VEGVGVVRVLVTGHLGYIGSVTVPALLASGHDVVGLDTGFYDGCDFEPLEAQVPELRLDVRDVGPRELDGIDAVVHLAALSNDPMGALNPALTEEINYAATVSLGRAARDAGVRRFVLASSCSMYGSGGGAGALDETAPLAPLTEYAVSKVRSENGLLELASDTFSPIFMRNATAYGVSPRLRVDLVVNNLVGWATTTGTIRILSDGTPWRPLVHIRDIATAAVHLLEAPRELVHGEAFNVGPMDENYQVSKIAELVRRTVDGCDVEFAGNGDPDLRTYRVDFGKLARTLPDCSLSWTVARGVDELAGAYARAGLSVDEFEGSRYTRLKHLQALLDEGRLSAELRWR
jgi:nucleoside-diphosphate-sugar epimerase